MTAITSKHFSWLDATAAFAMIVASAVVVYVNVRPSAAIPSRKAIAKPSEVQPLDDAQVRGNSKASVAIIEYSDFQCPYCARFANDTLLTLEKEYVDTGRVLLAFRHLPLVDIHPFAQKAAEAAECAGQSGRFWQMHDRLFSDQKSLNEPGLLASGAAVGLETKSFATCLAGSTAEKVKADAAQAGKLGLTGTPAFLIGAVQTTGGVKVTDVLSGARPIGEFRAVLDRALSARQP